MTLYSLKDIVLTEDKLFLIFEYLDYDLKKYMNRFGVVSPTQVKVHYIIYIYIYIIHIVIYLPTTTGTGILPRTPSNAQGPKATEPAN